MPSRADFYIGQEWLGSAAWDVYPSGVEEDMPEVLQATTEGEFRKAVESYLDLKGDSATWPHQGWPWPWNDSDTSDNTYLFVDGETLVRDYSGPFYRWASEEIVDVDWSPPDMSERKKVRWDQGGGAPMIFTTGPDGSITINN